MVTDSEQQRFERPTAPANARTIGLAGNRSTGKTTFIAVLTKVLAYQNATRGRDAATIYCRPSSADNGETKTNLERIWRRIHSSGDFPSATRFVARDPGSTQPIERYLIEVCDRGNDAVRAIIACDDWPGEVIDIYYEDQEVLRHARQDALRDLATYDGLIYLFDPYSGAYAGEKAITATGPLSIEAFFNDLRVLHLQARQQGNNKGQKLATPIALCLSQIDLPEHWPHREDPARYARMLWEGIEGALSRTIAPGFYKWFAVSAVGVKKDKNGLLRSNTYERQGNQGVWRRHIRDPDLEPFGVGEPVEWLLGQLENKG